MHFPSAMRLLKGSADFALDLISLLINQTTKHQRASSRTRYNPKIIIYSSSIPNEWKRQARAGWGRRIPGKDGITFRFKRETCGGISTPINGHLSVRSAAI